MTSPFDKARLARATFAALSLTLAGTLAACGSSTPATKGGTPGQSTSGGANLQALSPTTGLPQASAPKWPVTVVKIPNTPEAFQQVGLNQADIVAEELVEGGITRLEVVFYSSMPGLVGPVRSMRNSDIGMVLPLHGLLVSSGAAPATIRALNHAGVHYIQDGVGYFRDSSRVAPYNDMVQLAREITHHESGVVAPNPLFDFGPANTVLKGHKATRIAATFSGYRTTHFRYEGGHYVNTNGYAGSQGFLADNVLVLRVHEGNAGYLDPAGNPVPETILSGSGSMTLFHNGVAVTGRWFKASRSADFVLKTAKGVVIRIPAGRTYIEEVPLASAFGGGGLRYN